MPSINALRVLPSINALRVLAQRIDPNRLARIDVLRIENAIQDAYRIGFSAGADWQATQTTNATLTGRL